MKTLTRQKNPLAWALIALMAAVQLQAVTVEPGPRPDPATYFPGHPVNLSTRAKVSPGNPVIAGLVVASGKNGMITLIRAVGPSLARQGVTDALADPKIELYQINPGGPSTLISTAVADKTNGGFLFGIESLVGAYQIPSRTGDRYLYQELSPGVYTAVVTSESNGSGTVLVEVYEVYLKDLLVAGQYSPDTPVVIGPTSTTVNAVCTYTVAAADQNKDTVKYGVDWDGDGIPDEFTKLVSSGTAVDITHSWNKPGTYEVAFVAQDSSRLSGSYYVLPVTVK